MRCLLQKGDVPAVQKIKETADEYFFGHASILLIN
jgi:hypothetical protein